MGILIRSYPFSSHSFILPPTLFYPPTFSVNFNIMIFLYFSVYFNVVDNHGVPLIREECSFETGQEFAVAVVLIK